MWCVKNRSVQSATHKIILLWPNIGLPKGTSYIKKRNIDGHNHIETSLLICYANQWTGFYMIEISIMNELVVYSKLLILQK